MLKVLLAGNLNEESLIDKCCSFLALQYVQLYDNEVIISMLREMVKQDTIGQIIQVHQAHIARLRNCSICLSKCPHLIWQQVKINLF